MRLGEGNPPEIILEVTEPLKQVYGKVHGGAIAGLIDSAMAAAVNTHIALEQGASTVELKINFLLPVEDGNLYAQGEVISKGKRLLVCECRVRNENGELVAIGLGTFRVYHLKGAIS